MKNPNSILNVEAFRHVPGLDDLPLAQSNTLFGSAGQVTGDSVQPDRNL